MNNLRKNNTWKLVKFPEDRKAISCRWVYIITQDANENIEKYRAGLVVKRYSSKPDIDINKIFSIITQVSIIYNVRVVAVLDSELEQ